MAPTQIYNCYNNAWSARELRKEAKDTMYNIYLIQWVKCHGR